MATKAKVQGSTFIALSTSMSPYFIIHIPQVPEFDRRRSPCTNDGSCVVICGYRKGFREKAVQVKEADVGVR